MVSPSALLLALLLVCCPHPGLPQPSSSSSDPDADSAGSAASSTGSLHKVEGKVYPPDNRPRDWFWNTKVVVDGGKKVGFIREDNTFVVNGLAPGSYLLEVSSPDYFYEPVRIDINSKGKIRARKVNNVQPSQVTQVPYPLKLKSLGRHRYFQQREEWKVTDMLMNPMVMMMLLPLLLITVLPKMMNDPETKKEMENMQQSMNVQNQMPDMSEMVANFFGGGSTSSADKNKKKALGSSSSSSKPARR